MDTLQCAIVLAKFERFEWEVAQRIEIGKRYNELFAGKVEVVTQRTDRTTVYGQYTVLVYDREAIQQKLKEKNIPTAVHYPTPLHLQPAYAYLGKRAGDFPVAEALSKRVMSLPMSPDLSKEDQLLVVAAMQ